MVSCRSALAASLTLAAALVLTPAPARATLIGDTIQGALYFPGFSGNWFDPGDHPGQQTGSSGIQPDADVIDPDPTFTEFFYTDGTCPNCRVNISVDVDADTIEITEFLVNEANPATNILGWDIWLTGLDWSGPPGSIQSAGVDSTEFTGLTLSFTSTSVHITYAGGQDIDPGSVTDPRNSLAVQISLNSPPPASVPEPSSFLLLGGGLLGFALSRRGGRGPAR
jgi:hypothetical protein